VADARRTVQTVQADRSLVFFPEGTFTRMPGLLPFHMGAFVAAAEAGVPVVPVTIRGTRSLLRAGESGAFSAADSSEAASSLCTASEARTATGLPSSSSMHSQIRARK
jgi:hypothetical protein